MVLESFIMYAKIKDGVIVKFPFTIDDLQAENPSINFGLVFNLSETFSKTENGISGETVEEVFFDTRPTLDSTTQKLVENLFPEFVDGKWLIRYVIVDRTQEELDLLKSIST